MVPILLLWLLLLTVGCDLANRISNAGNTAVPPSTNDNATAVADNTPAPESTPDIAIPTSAVTQTRPLLRIWLPPEIALSTEEGATILNAQLAAYRSNHPELDLIVEQKLVSGQSGILNYLRRGRSIAPTILPDLIAIPADQLDLALNEDLIFPIDGLIETSLLEDLYPAALALVLKENQVSGYPFAITHLNHLAYNGATVTTTVPTQWQQLSALPNRLVFAANSSTGGTLALQLYLEAGGTLTNEAGQVALQVPQLVTALQTLAQAKNSGLILDQSSNYTSLLDSWRLFQSGSADFVITTPEQFLQERNDEARYLVAAVPGLDRPLTPLVSGWVWAISTANPQQRDMAIDLLTTLIVSDQLGEWSYASNFLPSTQTALDTWPDSDAYIAFARAQLNLAEALPINPNGEVMTALNNAVFDVLTQAQTPQQAAQAAVESLQQ